MRSRTWLAWVVLAPTAILGAKWLEAQEGPEIGLPPAPPRVEAPRPFKPTVPVDDLNAVPVPRQVRREVPIEAGVLEVPADSGEAPAPSRRSTRPAENRRAETPSTIRRTSALEMEAAEPSASPLITSSEERAFDQNISIEWLMPDQVRLGQPFVCEMIVRNNGSSIVEGVQVHDLLPASCRLLTAEPAALEESGEHRWEANQIAPHDEFRVKMELVAEAKGPVTHQARVSATTLAPASVQVTEPQLAVKASMPEKILVGDPATVTLEVSNPGDGPADDVVVRALLSDGLRNEKGSDFTVEVGTLAAGETRPIQLVCQTTASGKQSVQVSAVGSGGLEANATGEMMVTQATVDFALEGPGLRYLDRNAVYTIKVTNTGDAPAENVKVLATIPSGFKYAGHSTGGRHDFASSSVSWMLGSIPAGETKEVSYKCQASQTGDQKHIALVTGGRGLQKETQCVTKVEGISALLLEVVDVDDPVEVGSETSYEIRVTNQGSREATNVEIHALVPAEMAVKGAEGPARYRIEGQEVLFAPLGKLAPRADAIYRVHVAGAGKGDVRFRARLISDSLTEPVIEEESTKVYGD